MGTIILAILIVHLKYLVQISESGALLHQIPGVLVAHNLKVSGAHMAGCIFELAVNMGTVASAMLELMGFEHRGFLITDPEASMLTVLPARHREAISVRDALGESSSYLICIADRF